MSWENPKTNWGQPGQTVPGVDDFNRIEGNILELQNTKETPAGAQAKVDTHAAVKADFLNLGHVKQGTYLSIDTDGVISADATSIRTDTSKPLRAEVRSSAPSSPANGQIWYDSSNHKFKGYANGAWV